MTHNTQQKAPGACDSKGLHTDHNSADFRSHGLIQQAHGGKTLITRATLAYNGIKDTVSEFYIQRGIGIEAIGALILVAVFAVMRVFQ
jgi:hypothetical protein